MVSIQVMRADTTFFYDVDTQRDFILPEGALHGPSAVAIVPALKAVTDFARERKIRIVASVCRHFVGDRELQSCGGPYPDHCMNGTSGQLKIDETNPTAPLFVGNDRDLSNVEFAALIGYPGELIVEKQDLHLFSGNRNARKLIAHLFERYRDVVVYGVFTDLCVDLVVRDFAKYDRKVHVVTDAIAALDEGNARAAIEAWKAAGIDLLSFAELRSRLR
jgi:nicotinamidase/pyrazinamidase